MAKTNVKGMTKKEMFLKLLTLSQVTDNQELVDKINHEIELLDSKSAKSGTASAKKLEENMVLANQVYDLLKNYENGVRVSDLTKDCKLDINASKMTYILGLLKDNGQVERIQNGKKVLYKAL